MNGQLTLGVVNKSTGCGLAGAVVKGCLIGRGSYSALGKHETDGDGQSVIALPNGPIPTLILRAFCDGYVPRRVRWLVNHGDDLPNKYTLQLDPGVTIGGVVQNDQGQTVPRAKVTLEQIQAHDPIARELSDWPRDDYAIEADENGAWICRFAPAGLTDLTILVSHPEYEETHCVVEDRKYIPELQRIAKEALLARESVIVLQRGMPVSGWVVDPGGQPVAGAKVTLNLEMLGFGRQCGSTDAAGRFLFPHCPILHLPQPAPTKPNGESLRLEDRWKVKVIVEAEGFAPALRKFAMEHPPGELRIGLTKGVPFRGRVIDVAGHPMAGAQVSLHWQPEGQAAARQGVGFFWTSQTDAAGHFEWNSAPEGELACHILKDGFANLRKEAAAGRAEVTCTLQTAGQVSGTVLEAESQQPITQFRACPLKLEELKRGGDFWPREVFFGKNGRYKIAVHDPEVRGLHIEADGYEPQRIEKFPKPGESIELNFDLKRQAYLGGTVVAAEGHPAAGAQVHLSTLLRRAQLEESKLTSVFSRRTTVHETDREGRFRIPKVTESAAALERLTGQAPINVVGWGIHVVVAAHESGFAEVREDDLEATGKIILQPWGRIQGELMIGDQPGRGQVIRVTREGKSDWRAGAWVFSQTDRHTDDEGRFEYAHVPAGEYTVRRMVNVNGPEESTHMTPITVNPGLVTRIKLGGAGRLLIGRVTVDKPDRQIDWGWGLYALYPKLPSGSDSLSVRTAEVRSQDGRVISRRTFVNGGGGEEIKGYPVLVSPDGSFRIEEVPPGEYWISFTLREPRQDPAAHGPGPQIGHLTKEVNVPPAGPSIRESIDLGTLVIP